MIGPAGALRRFGLGPRPGDLETFSDVRGAIVVELDHPGIADLSPGALPTSPDALAAYVAERQAERQAQAAAATNNMLLDLPPPMAPTAPAMAPAAPAMEAAPQRQVSVAQRTFTAEAAARLAHARTVEIGFVERLVSFWTNHFAIEIGAGQTERVLAGAFEREAVRPFVLGRFRDMLGAVTKHPAMLSYLDNAQSIGPNSPQGQERNLGLNENHARELLELHTLGVDGGYSQADVTAMARILTGWTYAANGNQPAPIGEFFFRRGAHEPGNHAVMGVVYPARGIDQGELALDTLAAHPATARHLALKLARHFVADEPPPALVDELATVFMSTNGDLKAFARALVEADGAHADATRLAAPQLFLWSAVRALGIDLPVQNAIQALRTLGHPLWDPPSPEGFPDDEASWLAPDAITNRLDYAETLAERATVEANPNELIDLVIGPEVSAETRQAVGRAGSERQALALFLMSPEFQRR